MDKQLVVIVYGVTIVASAVAGGYLPAVIRMTHVRMQMILSFVGGLMLGIAVLHLLPHSWEKTQSITATMHAMLAGLLATFLMMRAFQFHQHDHQDETDGGCEHEHGHPQPGSPAKLSWLGVVFGLSIHTFIDGVALGSDVVAHTGAVPGFGVYLAILLHKPLDALSVSSLMHTQGWSRRSIQAANACFALMCPLGALCVVWGIGANGPGLGYLLAAAAGVFLCISLSDLLPEVQFHRHDRLQLSCALLLGIAVAFGMEALHQH